MSHLTDRLRKHLASPLEAADLIDAIDAEVAAYWSQPAASDRVTVKRAQGTLLAIRELIHPEADQ